MVSGPVSGEQAPLTEHINVQVAAVATASDATPAVDRSPFDGTVTGVTYTPNAAITGAATNTRAVSLVNKGQTGAGSTVVATLEFDSGVNGVAYDEKAIPLSGTPANLVVAQGDVLEWQSSHVGTGLADPGGMVHIEISRI